MAKFSTIIFAVAVALFAGVQATEFCPEFANTNQCGQTLVDSGCTTGNELATHTPAEWSQDLGNVVYPVFADGSLGVGSEHCPNGCTNGHC